MPKRNTTNLVTQITKKITKNAPYVLMAVGVFFMVLSATHWILQARSLRLESDLVEQYAHTQTESAPIPTHIYIEWFVDTPIQPHVYQNGQWTTSPNTASYLVQSATPGQHGNSIIYGHNTRGIMGNIRALKGTETIVITLSDGTKKEYEISTITEVTPNETSYLEPTNTEILTLYTCSGFLDKNRFIVQAKPKQY